jgi:hypothetical protein
VDIEADEHPEMTTTPMRKGGKVFCSIGGDDGVVALGDVHLIGIEPAEAAEEVAAAPRWIERKDGGNDRALEDGILALDRG